MRTYKKDITKEKENGRIYTPVYMVDNILDLSSYYGREVIKKHVIDNSCGDGAFLCQVVKRYCEAAVSQNYSTDEIRKNLGEYVHGIEIDETEQKKCIANVTREALRYGIRDVKWDIVCGDALTIDKYNGKMDFVVGNPPYVRIHNLSGEINDIKDFAFAQGGMIDLFIVFYEIGLKMLTSKGVLGYITPSSFFNSLAGKIMRRTLCEQRLLDKVVDLKHYQAFSATAYTAIVILKKDKVDDTMDYYQFDERNQIPYYVDSLTVSDYCIAENFYFAPKGELCTLKKIYGNIGKSDILVKNGYATLCDDVFVHEFTFESEFIIPVVKSSKGMQQRIFYPYTSQGKLVSEEELKKDEKMYQYLMNNKEKLLKRSNEKDSERYWYSFGRSQAINDTYKDKLAINALIRDEKDLKFVEAPAGVGVYGGLYIVSNSISTKDISDVMRSEEFASYVTLLGKYKSGGYYTYSSKDVKLFLDYKFAYNGGLLQC